MAKSNTKNLPEFQSLDALVAFFDSNDMGEYADSMPEADFEVSIESKRFVISLDGEDADKLSMMAKSAKTSPIRLVTSWVREKIAEH